MSYLTVKATFTITLPSSFDKATFDKLSAAEKLKIMKDRVNELDMNLVDGINEMDEASQSWLEANVQVVKVDEDTVQYHIDEYLN